MPNFQRYSKFYDLLYRDKDYAAEADYVARMIRDSIPLARTILELGSGTGRHGRLLAGMGFEVQGIERSPEMVSFAQTSEPNPPSESAGFFRCDLGDICTTNLRRTFDAVVSLFHVVSYQTTNQALEAVFRVAANHLAPGGLFLFDVWHGPAVLSQGVSARVKRIADERFRVQRTAQPELDGDRGTVKVVYQLDCEDLQTGEKLQFSEEHLMRYLFPTEVDVLAENSGLRRIAAEEFLTGRPPSQSTWGVMYGLQR